jgi:hypothetical protein
MRRIAICILLMCAAVEPASAAFSYDGGTRTVTAGAGNGFTGNGDSKSTAALGSWFESVAASYSDLNGSSSGAATQLSDLGSSAISMLASVSGGATGAPYSGAGISSLGAEFEIAANTPYESILTTAGGGMTTFSLSTSGGTISYDANSSGILVPGHYTLFVSFQATSPPEGGLTGGDISYGLSIESAVPELSSAWLWAVVLGTIFAGRSIRIRAGKGV